MPTQLWLGDDKVENRGEVKEYLRRTLSLPRRRAHQADSRALRSWIRRSWLGRPSRERRQSGRDAPFWDLVHDLGTLDRVEDGEEDGEQSGETGER